MIPRNEKPCKRYQHLQGSHPEHIDEQRRHAQYSTAAAEKKGGFL